jgi:hypothetical protein
MDHVAIVNRVIGSYSKATSQMQMQLDQRPHIGDASESQKGVFYLGYRVTCRESVIPRARAAPHAGGRLLSGGERSGLGFRI